MFLVVWWVSQFTSTGLCFFWRMSSFSGGGSSIEESHDSLAAIWVLLSAETCPHQQPTPACVTHCGEACDQNRPAMTPWNLHFKGWLRNVLLCCLSVALSALYCFFFYLKYGVRCKSKLVFYIFLALWPCILVRAFSSDHWLPCFLTLEIQPLPL